MLDAPAAVVAVCVVASVTELIESLFIKPLDVKAVYPDPVETTVP